MFTLADNRTFFLSTSLLLVLIALSALRIVQLQDLIIGANDQYTYWYFGHFLRDQINPYIAYINNLTPKTPVEYLDGRVFGSVPAPQGGVHAPTNTPPNMLLLGGLSVLSWYTAKPIWLFCNLLMAVTAPLIMAKIAAPWAALSRRGLLFLCLLFWASSGVRLTLHQGQTVLLVLTFLLASIYFLQQEKMILAGFFLGCALSKYSLTLPMIFIFALWRAYAALAVAFVTQLGGLMLVAVYTNTSLWQTLGAMLTIITDHTGNRGLHLSAWIPNGDVVLLVVSAGVLLYLNGFLRHFVVASKRTHATYSLLHFTSIGFCWIYHLGYHNRSDAVTLLFYFMLVTAALDQDSWRLTNRQRQALLWLSLGAVGLLTLPTDNLALPLLLRNAWSLLGSLSTVAIGLLVAIMFGRKSQNESPFSDQLLT